MRQGCHQSWKFIVLHVVPKNKVKNKLVIYSSSIVKMISSEKRNILCCKHCDERILSWERIPHHNCFIGKEVYMDKGNMLFTEIPTEDSQSSSHISYDNNPEKMVLISQEVEAKELTNKQNAVWNKNGTLALFSLYEANLNMLNHPKKKTKLWTAISEGLKDLNIEMSSDQVRWKMNSLIKKYKECVDNNSKSGRGTMSFEFYDQMEEIFGKERNATAHHTVSSNLPLNNNRNPVIDIQSPKRKETEDLHNQISNTSTSKVTIASTDVKIDSTGKRFRSAHGTGSNKSRTKLDLEKQWLQHLQNEEKRLIDREERNAKFLQTKTDALQLKKRQLQMQEKQLEINKMLATNKLKAKERRHEEVMEIEKLKCKLLKKLLNDKENVELNSDYE